MNRSIMNETDLYFEVHGSQGPYLLLVHGILSSRAQWIPNLPFLSTFCRPVVVELFGHGRSPSPDNREVYTPDSTVQAFEKIRKELGIEKWFLCGQSLGASLTLRYGLTHPESVVAQIFTNSRSALSENQTEEMMKTVAERLKKEGPGLLEQLPLNPAGSRHLDPEVKEALIRDIALIDLKGFAHMLVHMVTKCSVNRIIQGNTVPTLLIVGRFDKQFEPLIEFALENIPNLEMKILDGGHAVNIDASDSFNRTVKEFIERFL
jgi:2-succinyl-6-hydroxy-2,4-cyclohexadiene-1-carboxylate synthase